jgi:hypothetical protein
MSLRRHTISTVSALWLVALILLPFTAPFKTYDLFGSDTGHSHVGLVKDKIGSDEKVVDPADESPVPPFLNAIVIESFSSTNQIEEHPLQHAILRI